jgi:hypothetical protein
MLAVDPVKGMPGVETICRVCGYDTGEDLWTNDDQVSAASSIHCECCGMMSGYQDCLPASARKYREEWLAAGAPWRGRSTWRGRTTRPHGWNVDRQLEQVPAPYR